MALKAFKTASEAQSFVTIMSTTGLVGEFQKYAWSSCGFSDKDTWSSALLLKFAYKLSGGRFVVKEGLADSSGEKIPSSLTIKDEILHESLEGESYEDLLSLIRHFYLGSTLAVGSTGNSSVLSLCEKVSRFWDASVDDGAGRSAVGACLDGFILMENSGIDLRPLAVCLHRLGITSRLGVFCGSGVRATTTKRRLLNFFYEVSPPSTVNGLICLASSPSDCLSLFVSHWTTESIEELETAEAAAMCTALGLSPTTSASAPRLLALTLAENSPVVATKAIISGEAMSKVPATDFCLGPVPPPSLYPPAPLEEVSVQMSHPRDPAVTSKAVKRPKQVKRPDPLQLVDEDISEDSNSESELEDPEEQLARRLTELMSPRTRKSRKSQSLSSAAIKVIRSLPQDSQKKFEVVVNEHRLSVVSKQDLESLRAVFLKNKAAVEMFLARRPIADSMVQKGRSSGIAILPVYQNTRLGCPAHLCVLGEELMVRMAGGLSLEASMAERQGRMKDESLRQEHASLGEVLVLLLDELHPEGVLELRAAERIMRRLVGLEIAADKKAKSNQPIHKSMADLAIFMGTGMRVSSGVQDQTQK